MKKKSFLSNDAEGGNGRGLKNGKNWKELLIKSREKEKLDDAVKGSDGKTYALQRKMYGFKRPQKIDLHISN